jgi:hypothetical protein
VAEYRAYTVGSDGHFIGFDPLVCADDVEAIEKAKRLLEGSDIELWSGARFVIRLPYKKRSRAASVAASFIPLPFHRCERKRPQPGGELRPSVEIAGGLATLR